MPHVACTVATQVAITNSGGRLRPALGLIVPPMLAASLTTAAGGLALTPCTVIFFQRFGATAWSKWAPRHCPTPARLLCLLRARPAALVSSTLPERGLPTEQPASASGARATHLQSRRFHRLWPSRRLRPRHVARRPRLRRRPPARPTALRRCRHARGRRARDGGRSAGGGRRDRAPATERPGRGASQQQ